jgi:plasmid stabilization system protein ParE
MAVRWTRFAQRHLREIVGYIARDSPKAARDLAERIRRVADKIENQPLAGRIVPEVGDAAIRERVAPPYRILYSVARSEPKILAIYHQRRLLPLDEIED